VLAQAIDLDSGRVPTRCPGNQWHSQNLIVHRPFLAVAMIGQAITMVAGEEDDGVFEIALGIESLQDLTHLLVDHRHIGQVVSPLAVTLLGGRVEQVDDRVVVDLGIVFPHLLKRRRL